MKPNDQGGIDIYIAAKKPEEGPEENWVPLDRQGEDIGAIPRIWAADSEKPNNWRSPKAEK